MQRRTLVPRRATACERDEGAPCGAPSCAVQTIGQSARALQIVSIRIIVTSYGSQLALGRRSSM